MLSAHTLVHVRSLGFAEPQLSLVAARQYRAHDDRFFLARFE